jgi:L-malate glycosyltransferase
MKIGITCHTSAGGSGIMATELGIALARLGHEVHFVTYDPLFRLQAFHEGIYCHHVDRISYPVLQAPPYTLALASRICEVAEEYGIDIWHAHYAIPYAACALIARDMVESRPPFKVITTLHGTDITLVGSDPSYFRLTKHAMEKSDAVTAVSNWLTRETQTTFSLTTVPRTIYNFLNEDRFEVNPGERKRLAEDDEKIIMHISNFRPVKRVTDVVRVFHKIARQMPARLIMVGDGPERISAVGVARQLGISDKIRYLGTYERIEAILPFADLVLQPSEHESFGLVPLEAMACEVPVIATASGGICEVVVDGETGYLCEVGDTDAMARYGIDLLENPDKAKEMGRKGRERALSHFWRDTIVDQYIELYKEVLSIP